MPRIYTKKTDTEYARKQRQKEAVLLLSKLNKKLSYYRIAKSIGKTWESVYDWAMDRRSPSEKSLKKLKALYTVTCKAKSK